MDFIRRVLFLPPEASSVSSGIDRLHMVVIGATMLGAFGVLTLAVFFIFRYRARGRAERTPLIRMPTLLEVSLISGTLGLFLAFWVVGYRQYANLETMPRNGLEIIVTAKQWMWTFSYPDGHDELGILTVPIGRPVRLVMTSRDVIHSFFVPAFRLKQDVLPGRYTSLWFTPTMTGTWDVFCAEYCGLSHSRMRAAVHVVTAAEYAQWMSSDERGDGTSIAAGGERAETRLARYGREVALRHGCFACHTVDGQRHIGPTWRALFGATVPLADGRTVIADEAYLTRSMMDPAADVVASFPTVMPTFRGSLEGPEAAALVEFIRSLRTAGPAPAVALPAIADGGVTLPGPDLTRTVPNPIDEGAGPPRAIEGSGVMGTHTGSTIARPANPPRGPDTARGATP